MSRLARFVGGPLDGTERQINDGAVYVVARSDPLTSAQIPDVSPIAALSIVTGEYRAAGIVRVGDPVSVFEWRGWSDERGGAFQRALEAEIEAIKADLARQVLDPSAFNPTPAQLGWWNSNVADPAPLTMATLNAALANISRGWEPPAPGAIERDEAGRYVPDAEARELAERNAERRGMKSGTGHAGVNFDVDRMRRVEAAAEDPFGLDDLVDGRWPD